MYKVNYTNESGDKFTICQCDSKSDAARRMDEEFFDKVSIISSKQTADKNMEIYSCDDKICFIEYTNVSDGSRHTIKWELEEEKGLK